MAQARDSDAFLVGRTTFEEMRSYWPQQLQDATGVTDHLNRVAKYVVSTTLEDPKWDGTTILRGPLDDEARAMKGTEGSDIVVTGSILLCHALIDADLVDEYRLFTYPHVEGRGRRLFKNHTTVPALRNLSTFLGQFVSWIIESVSLGRLIQVVPGSGGGSGCLRTKRSGWAV